MNAPPLSSNRSSSYTPAARGYCCPICKGPVERIPRRFIDRLTSLFKPVHRYRCFSKGWGCDWEGNLPIKPR